MLAYPRPSNAHRLILAGMLLCIAGPAAASGRTIVGEWAPDPRNCTPMGGAIGIRPLAIVGDEMRCDFDSVARSGDVVTWRGACGFPHPARRATVVASLRGETLAIRYNGGSSDVYRRCGR